jgi:O-antigen/teichoic acid export membrane protein
MSVETKALDISVIIPARNAAKWLAECLESVRSQHPREIIVVDGCSRDSTVEIARTYGARVISDEGRGLPAARMMGTKNAVCAMVALIDADVVLPPDALGSLLIEFEAGGFDGLQFGLVSESDGAGYWGAALAWHHNHSRVRSWFGVCATLMRRDALLEAGFDEAFSSGEDVELRMRLQEAGQLLGVSTTTLVRHRFADDFAFARDQWLQDGAGMALTIRKHPRRAGWLLLLPLLATGRGVALSLVSAPRYLPYWAGFLLYNYRAMASELVRPAPEGLSLGGNAAWLTAARVAPMITGFLFWALAAFLLPPAQLGLGSAVVAAALLTVQVGMLGVGPATLTLLPAQADGGRRLIATSLLTVGLSSLAVAAGLILITRAIGPGVGQAWDDPVVLVAFLAAAFFATTAYQLDHVDVALSRSDLALVRSLLQGLLQLAVLVICLAFGYQSLKAVVGAVAAGALASVLLGVRQLYRAGLAPQWKPRILFRQILGLLRPALPNHPLMLADRAPGYLLPLIVASTLSTSATAAWYVVWMLASAVFFVPQSAGYSLQTKLASRDSGPSLVGGALRISFILTFVAGGILLGVGPLVLKVLGPLYAPHWVLLPLLVPALILSCVTQIYYGVCRARGHLAEATAVALLAGVIAVAPAVFVTRSYALPGVSMLWLAAQLSAALIAAWRLRDLARAVEGAKPYKVPARRFGGSAGVEAP